MNRNGSAHLARENRRAISDSLGRGMQIEEIVASVRDYVRFFNEERPAFAFGYLTPKQCVKKFCGMPKAIQMFRCNWQPAI